MDFYFRDKIKNPEIAVLLMIVNDNNDDKKEKRKALLNPNYTKIGIVSKFVGDKFFAHFSFSK